MIIKILYCNYMCKNPVFWSEMTTNQIFINIKLVVNRKVLGIKYSRRILNCLVVGYVGTFCQTLTTVQITCLSKEIK